MPTTKNSAHRPWSSHVSQYTRTGQTRTINDAPTPLLVAGFTPERVPVDRQCEDHDRLFVG